MIGFQQFAFHGRHLKWPLFWSLGNPLGKIRYFSRNNKRKNIPLNNLMRIPGHFSIYGLKICVQVANA